MNGKMEAPRDLPASSMQTLFWRMQTADPSSRDFLVVTAFRISGRIQADLLRKCFEAVIASQPALRTVFRERNGELLQSILPHMSLPWEHLEVPSIEIPEDIEGIRTLFRDFRSQTFDLGQGPLMRVRLLSAGRVDHLLQIAVHHTVSDGTSMNLLLDAVSASYNSLFNGGESHIEQTSDSYGGFAIQERQWLSSEYGARSQQYWIRRLQKRGLLHPWPSWGGISESPKRVIEPSGVFEWAFDGALSMSVGSLASRYRLSRFRVLLATYCMSLQRMHPARPVTVGVAVDMRRESDDKPSIGCLINMLPVTVDGEPAGKVEEYLRNAAREVDDALAHAKAPYPDMLEAWMKEENDLRSARWKTLLNLKDTESGRLNLQGCICKKVHEHLNEILQNDRSSDLSITMTRTAREKGDRPIRMLVRYDENALSRQQVETILESWESVLRQCIAAPEAKFDSIALPGIIGKYADWQKRLASKGIKQRLESYWKERLSDLGEPANLISDPKSSMGNQGRKEILSKSMDSSIHSLMNGYCRQEGISRHATWISIWQILQARLGRGEEVLIAVPVADPGESGSIDVMGNHLNTLPIRTKVDEQTDFRSFSRSNHESIAQDHAHGLLPYEDIIRLADGDLGTDGQGKPQVMFVWHGEHEWRKKDGMSVNISPKARYTVNPFIVHVTDNAQVCRATFEYDAERFIEQTAGNILLRFESVARQVLENPDMPISDIDILLPGEWKRIQDLSGRENKAAFPDMTMQEIFRQTADRYPARPALVEADGRELSYADLKEKVERMAAFLERLGVGEEKIIAVYVERSPNLLISLLGILEAGGAFLLIDPAQPEDRIQYMLEKAGVFCILSEENMPWIPGFAGKTHHCSRAMQMPVPRGRASARTEDPTSLAYVFYTSGTTGFPKGVMIEHRHLVNRMFALVEDFELTENDRTLLKAALSFDVCITELLIPMMVGGAVVLSAKGRDSVSVQEIAELAIRHRVTYLPIAPSVLKALLETPDVKQMNGIVRIVNCGGEGLGEPVMRCCLDTLDARLNHAYGPTETAISICQWRCHNDHGYPGLPIGKPYPNTWFYIMDAKGRPVPPGMPGELWIGGAQTGRGYINHEEETRKRFVDDPLEPGSGRRYYRTGDVARFLPDGNLLFIGRIDDQLKVRGVRIEPGDVTAALLRCEGVREAVVLPEPDGEGSNRLRAWVTVKDGAAVGESSVRISLSELLPNYMVPFRIHVIDSIPLTPHGKTDHRALRAIAEQEGDGAEGLPLTTDTEHRLAAVWSELLGIEVLHRDADFFRLGGHSLIAMRLPGRIHKEFKLRMPLPEFYADARLERLAAWIDRRHSERDGASLPEDDAYKTYPIWEGKGSLKVFSFIMGFENFRRMAELRRWEWSIVHLMHPQEQREQRPDMPVESLAPVYADAILAEHRKGPIVLLGNCISGIDAYATACLLQKRTKDPIHVLLFDTHCPDRYDVAAQPPERPRQPTDFLYRTIGDAVTEAIRRSHGKNPLATKAANAAARAFVKEALTYRLFDPEWYLSNYPDLLKTGIDPVFHYFNLGWKEDRQPSLIFNASLYKHICPDYQPERQNPVLHYLLIGRFNASVRRSVRSLQTSAKDAERIMASGWFDAEWYASEYPSVPFHGRNPLEHYMAIGWRFGRKPFPDYNPIEFRKWMPDFEPEKTNPLRHLLSMARIPHLSGFESLKNTEYTNSDSPFVSPHPESQAAGEGTDPWRHIRRRQPVDLNEVMGMRSEIRKQYRPESFNGDLYLFANQFLHDLDPTIGWRNGIHGRIHAFRMNGDHDSYLIDDLKSNIESVDKAMRMILHAESPKE